MGSMNKIIRYPSGLRLALHRMDGTRSIAIGIYVGCGSAYETPELSGISHFIEHMLFKGTEKRNAFQIAEEMESVGAQINAFTSREITSYYTISTDEHAEICMEMLSDIFFNATFTHDSIEKEKGVVLEEISMCEDDPADLCMDLLSLAYYGDSGLGRPILGKAETVKSFTADMMRKFISDHYSADNVVITVAGNAEHDRIYKLVEKYFEKPFVNKTRKESKVTPPDKASRLMTRSKAIEQANIAFAFPAYRYNHDLSLSVSLLSTVLGGGMSSRLFQKLREELGLVYDIYTTQSEYLKEGYFVIYLATNPATAVQAVKAVKEVLNVIKKDGITEREFLKGREQLKSAIVLGAERAASIMRAAGSRALLANKTFDLNERLDDINKITMDNINEVINYIFDFEKASASYVGRESEEDILKLLKS